MWVEKNGPAYRIRDEVAGRKVTLESGFPNKTAAKAKATILRGDKLKGDFIDPRGGKLLLDAWLDAWQPAYEAGLKPSTAYSEPGKIRNHIRPLLGEYALEDIDHLVVQQWVAKLLRGVGPFGDSGRPRRKLSAKTVRNCHGILYQILQAAVVAKQIRANPCVDTKLPKVPRKEMMFLTEQEFERLLIALPKHWRPLILLLVSTGLRWGEAIGLKVGRVDLLAKPHPKLRVEEQLQELPGGGGMVWVSPKSEQSYRTVPFTAQVAAALAGLVMGPRGAVVFTAPKGGLVGTRNFRRIWLRACKKAGLEGLRVHDLRHTHAAWLISAGRPLSAISRRLGHSSIAITDTLYGHLLPVVDEGIMAAIDAALAGVDLDAMAAEVDAELADILA